MGQYPGSIRFRRCAIRTFKINPADRTVLMAGDAEIIGPVSEVDLGPGKRGWIEGWTGRNDILGWQISLASAGQYEISVVAEGSSSRPAVEVGAGSGTLSARLPDRWERTVLGAVRLPEGKSTVTLRSAGEGKVKRLLSLELVRPTTRQAMAKRATKARPATDWLIAGKYGLMFHWTSQTQPRQGEALDYHSAVDAFPVQRFAETVAAAGAGHVIFTTSHAEYYWPGPNAAVDKILKGRTCRRDLIGELADALADRGIALMLYYHPGHGDEQWWAKTGFDKPAKSAFFKKWQSVIEDAGKRYGQRLAGWWFDDALMTYYPLNPPWEKLAASARKGNPERLICWNSWILPKVTEFGDLSSWEAYLEPELIRGHGHLLLDGDGRYTGGPQDGLQAHITTPATKGGWVHDKPNAPLGGQLYLTPKLIRMLTEALRRKCVVTMNLEVYQNATISRAAIEQFTEVRKALKTRRRKAE